MVRKQTPKLDALIAHVLQRCEARGRGSKAELADHLGVAPQLLNKWLNGSSEPGGEITLSLREWVYPEQAPNKEPDRALTRPGRKTQKQKSRDENTSGQQKEEHGSRHKSKRKADTRPENATKRRGGARRER